jgi:hypothetical protein
MFHRVLQDIQKIRLRRVTEIMNIWHDISPKRITKDKFYAVIEISKGGKNKYELEAGLV